MREHFVDKVVAWPNDDHEDCPLYLQCGGCGEILDVLEMGGGIIPYLLVRKIPSKDYPEPPYVFVLNLLHPDLQFFNSAEAYENWREFTLKFAQSDVIKLVKK